MSPTYLSDQDYQNYGHELIDVTQRAALHAVAPELQEIKQQNIELQQRLAKEARHRMDQQLELAVPNYRAIDVDPHWHRWLLGRDPLSGEVRQRLLNAASGRGDASSVIAFFKAYLREAGGAQAPAAGRAHTTSSNRPTYTPAQIGELYACHRKGAWAGREAEWARIEHDIFAAQREGRVQATPYLTK